VGRTVRGAPGNGSPDDGLPLAYDSPPPADGGSPDLAYSGSPLADGGLPDPAYGGRQSAHGGWSDLASGGLPVADDGPQSAGGGSSDPAGRPGRTGQSGQSRRDGRDGRAGRNGRGRRPEWDGRDGQDGLDRRDGRDRRSGGQLDPAADPEAAARQICLKMLTSAPRTRAQLAAALDRRGVPAEAAEAVLERFAEVQLIDDGMFARAWVESRHHGRGLARRALAAELRQRGVEADDIKEAVGRLDPEQEYATARALVDRRLAGTRSLEKPVRFRRLMGVLARKGYPEALAYRVVREALEYEPTEPEFGADPDDPAESLEA
jgi:regulatory protein